MIISTEIISQIGQNQLTENDIIEVQRKIGITIGSNITKFLIDYSDCFLHDCFYEDASIYVCPSYICGKSDNNPNIFNLINGNVFYEYKKWLPFAIDSGGWVFNISFNVDTYHQVWINKFDSGLAIPFEYVAPSLEHFFNKLSLG